MEEARIDFMDRMGFPYQRMEAEGVLSPVKSIQVNYLKPCTFGDEVDITVGVKEFNGVVITMMYDMRVNGEPVFSGTSEHVFLDRAGKFVRMKRVMPEFCKAVEERIVKTSEP
jgi:acyl-CoA thioester hydrolase